MAKEHSVVLSSHAQHDENTLKLIVVMPARLLRDATEPPGLYSLHGGTTQTVGL